MRVQLKKSSYGILSFLTLSLLISACGKSNKMANFVPAPQGNQQVIPTLDPFASGQPSNTSILAANLSVVAAPGQSANVGQVIYLFAYGSSGSSSNTYNFQFSSNSIGASFVGTSTGVQQVGVTSSGAGSVTVTVTTAAGTYSTGSITLNFTGSTMTPTSSPYSSCSIQGPYAISNYYSSGSPAYPQVGGSYYFSVQSNGSSYYGYGDQLKIVNVWTLDPSETGRYYNSWSQFWMTFNSAGSKTIYVRAQSQTTGAMCDAQITLNVSGGGYYPTPTPGPVPNSCGLDQGTSGQYCTMAIVYSYYFNGTSCQLNTGTNGCAPRGPFNSLSECQQAVAAGRCGGSSGGTPVTRQVSVDSRSTQWVDTGVDVSPSSAGYGSSLTVTTSGQIQHRVGAYSTADGVDSNAYQYCKVSNAQSFRNVALIGKIGVNGTPFLVGSYLNTSVTYSTGRLYLIVNDPGCASDNSGSFVANINFQRVQLMY
ncbi:MAG: hypothetical protein EBQ92_03585 [Proteobacteria bacterium]|nr:hypothetical protein [Pseudomonadota bacterium]